jgi:hypothetical protein
MNEELEDNDEVVFFVDGIKYHGWFRRTHDEHGKGLFGTYLPDSNKEYFPFDDVEKYIKI